MGKFGAHFGANYQRDEYKGGAGIKTTGEVYVLNKNRRKRKERLETYISSPVVISQESFISSPVRARIETNIKSSLKLKEAAITHIQSGVRQIKNTHIHAPVFDQAGRRVASKQERYHFLMKLLLEHLVRKEMARRK